MYTVQIVQHFAVEFCELLIDSDDAVVFILMTLFPMWTSGAVFTFIYRYFRRTYLIIPRKAGSSEPVFSFLGITKELLLL